MSVLSPFQILLNDLSNELHETNLHNLIHVCGDLIPAGQREKITSGWDAFSILRQLNVIGSEPEKMANLLAIIKELRPRRKDLVLKIKRHIQNNYEDPDLILKDLESSSDFTQRFHGTSRSSTPSISQIPQEDCCRIRCCGSACICQGCCDACCCCVILALLFFFLAIVAALAWYSNCVPVVSKYLDSHDDTAGPFVISILAFAAFCCVIGVIYFRYCRPAQLNYALLRNAAAHNIRSELPSYASLDSVHTSYINSAMGRRIERRRCESSCSSGHYTASNSLISRASPCYPPPPDDVVDCLPQGDYTAVFTQEVEEVEVDLTEV